MGSDGDGAYDGTRRVAGFLISHVNQLIRQAKASETLAGADQRDGGLVSGEIVASVDEDATIVQRRQSRRIPEGGFLSLNGRHGSAERDPLCPDRKQEEERAFGRRSPVRVPSSNRGRQDGVRR